jgi:hypothetical protein
MPNDFVTQEQVDILEFELGLKLPISFVNNILALKCQFDHDLQFGSKKLFVSKFLSYGGSDEGSSIRRALQYFPAALEEGYFPFAELGDGIFYFLKLDELIVYRNDSPCENEGMGEMDPLMEMNLFFSNLSPAF